MYIDVKFLLVLQAGLAPAETHLLLVIASNEHTFGRCTLGIRALADESGMSVPTVIKAKRGLEEKKIIRITKEKEKSGWDKNDTISTFMEDAELFAEFRKSLDEDFKLNHH